MFFHFFIAAYHDAKWRREMEDRDVMMLQLAAANMHPDDFLINVINKFQLVQWASDTFDCKEDDSIRQINIIAEEFLSTLIYVLGERYIPKVGNVSLEDCVRHEIVQILCMSPMAHSTLSKTLAEDSQNSGILDKVVDSVATFKRAYNNSASNGRYELRPEFYEQYNVFFYRFSRENQSKAEEAQRHRKKAANEAECNPPPLPPIFTKQFEPLLKMIESETFMHILKLVLDRADNLRSRCFSENQVHKILHLIGLCLLEQERSEIDFTKSAEKHEIYEKLQKLVGSQRIESHKDLLTWTINTWQRVAGIQMEVQESKSVEMDQKMDEVVDEKEVERKRLAAERRRKVMDQMKNAQKNFMKENKKLFDDTVHKRTRLDTNSELNSSIKEENIQCLGPDRAIPVTNEEKFHTCILCQDEEELKPAGNCLVTAAYIQKSTVLSNRRPLAYSDLGSKTFEPNVPLLSSDLSFGIHTSSCGHVMHSKCWKVYFEDIQNSERNRSRLRSPQNFNALRQEFLCPMCRRLSNTVIPLIPQLHTMQRIPNSTKSDEKMSEEQTLLEDMEENSSFVLSKGNEVDVSQPIRINFKSWLDALFIAQKYKKEIKSKAAEIESASGKF